MKNAKEAKKLFKELKISISKKPSPFASMEEEKVIEQLRKTREKFWEKKLATFQNDSLIVNFYKREKIMKNATEARKHLNKLKEIIKKNPAPIFKMKKDDIIKTLRKTREEIWEEKFAIRH
ncbi:hypothetical protein HY745_07065 [Candidatus Desantisbacteria bacterium]|nr:hypothetical protein [Candidatus Desantisbacteria bacterium]